MSEKSQKDLVIDFFQELGWPGMTFDENKISCPSGDIATLNGKFVSVTFHFFNRIQNKYEKRENRPTLILDGKVNPYSILASRRGGFDIQWFDYLKKILYIDDKFEKIRITKTGKKILKKTSEKTLQIPELIFTDIISDAYEVYKKGKSSKDRLETFLINKLRFKHSQKVPKDVTTIAKGDFTFMVERFNLKNKTGKKDYAKFLTDEDIGNLQSFTEKLIKDEVFSADFLRTLDEYFIKEKLKDIITIGRDILSLGSTDMTTEKAKKVISKVTDNKADIKQLETLWQKYFDKYLLYLVFSYKKIYPKVEFKNIEGEKKYPDFIGINHYNGLDIIEIKTHLKNAVVWDSSHKNFSFSSELSRAVIQTMNYMDAIVQKRFQNNSDEVKITNMTEEENLYHPRGIIIISSETKLAKNQLDKAKQRCLQRDFTKLRNSLQNIEILTFSEVLQIADDYVKNINDQYVVPQK